MIYVNVISFYSSNVKMPAFQVYRHSTPTVSAFSQIPVTSYSLLFAITRATIITKLLEYLLAEYQVSTGFLLLFIF